MSAEKTVWEIFQQHKVEMRVVEGGGNSSEARKKNVFEIYFGATVK